MIYIAPKSQKEILTSILTSAVAGIKDLHIVRRLVGLGFLAAV